MNFNITGKRKVFIVFLAICLLMTFVPTVLAAQPLVSSSDSEAPMSGLGFTTLDEDGGMLLIGTARVPSGDGQDFISVKYIYSDGIMLNKKSVELICQELKYCGITISQEMLVSNSDISNDSMTDVRSLVFACGSEENPTKLTSYPPYKSAEESFKHIYPAYNFSVSDYSSLKSLFDGNENVTLSEDGKTAYTSLVMKESYTEKIINGKPVVVLTVNSEFKYSFRAPKMLCVRDEYYVSDSDWHYPDADVSDTDTTSTSEQPTVTEPLGEQSSTTSSTSDPSKVTASATPITLPSDFEGTNGSSTSATQFTTESTTASTTTNSTTTATTTTKTTTATSKTTTNTTSKATTTTTTTKSTKTSATTVPTSSTSQTSATTKLITTVTRNTTTTTNDNPVFNRTTVNSLLSERGIVNTKRLPLNIRSGPGKKYMVVTVLPKGTYVTVLSTENPDWYMVKTMGKVVGYAYSEYIRIM